MIEEVLTWYMGWKQFILTENVDMILNKAKVEEVFYLMMRLIESKIPS